MTAFFTAPGRFFRGNLHTHSNLSDGALSPSEVCARYRQEGYDFISLTDHFVGRFGYPLADTKPYRTVDFTTLIGAELHSGAMENGELWHILAVGLPEDFAAANAPDFQPVAGQETGPQIAQRAADAGAFVAIAHPQWSGLTQADAFSITAAHAVETYNHGCAVGADRAEGFLTLEHLLSQGRRINLCATDDAHFTEPDHFGGWVMVKAEENAPGALLIALKAGHYYSSQGPELRDICVGTDEVTVRCSAAVTVIIQGQGSAAVPLHGQSMTRAEIPLTRFRQSPWIRITVIDAAGKRAWSNPIWL